MEQFYRQGLQHDTVVYARVTQSSAWQNMAQ